MLLFSGRPFSYGNIRYTDWTNANNSPLGTIECLTEEGPPTDVTWLRDDEPVLVDGDKYEMIQTVTDRGGFYYNNSLLIRHAADLVGSHIYTCIFANSRGGSNESISTTLTGERYYGKLIALVPGLPHSVCVLIMRRGQTFEKRGSIIKTRTERGRPGNEASKMIRCISPLLL